MECWASCLTSASHPLTSDLFTSGLQPPQPACKVKGCTNLALLRASFLKAGSQQSSGCLQCAWSLLSAPLECAAVAEAGQLSRHLGLKSNLLGLGFHQRYVATFTRVADHSASRRPPIGCCGSHRWLRRSDFASRCAATSRHHPDRRPASQVPPLHGLPPLPPAFVRHHQWLLLLQLLTAGTSSRILSLGKATKYACLFPARYAHVWEHVREQPWRCRRHCSCSRLDACSKCPPVRPSCISGRSADCLASRPQQSKRRGRQRWAAAQAQARA